MDYSRRSLIQTVALAGFGSVVTKVAAMDVETFRGLGLDKRFPADQLVNGRTNMELIDALNTAEDAQYHPCAEAYPGVEVPSGSYQQFDSWSQTRIYPSTYRDIGVYLPAQTDKSPLNLIVFNDGLGYADPNGPVRATSVLDTLIHQNEIPPTAAVFVMPGRLASGSAPSDPTQVSRADMNQRSDEYDRLTPDYGAFLQQELLPYIEQSLSVRFASDPGRRAICGISSGGICAFNTAWHYPEHFGHVISHCGSFVNIQGGHNYPYLVRSTPRKPIRVFLTSGKRDGNIILGNWPLANQQMASALEYAGYEHRFEFGEGGHNLRHGGALFAETLRWVWGS